MGIGKVKQK